MVLKIAHKGASGYASANTIEAFKKAVKLKVDVVEFDVHRTKDGKIVVMHAHNVNKTTDGLGLIRNLSLKELKKFHKPNGEAVPSLREVLMILKNKCICKIDIKDKGMAKRLVNIIKKNRLENSVIIASEFLSILKKIKRLCPGIKIELGGLNDKKEHHPDEIIKKAKSVKADIIAPFYKIVTKKLIEAAHENGLAVHVWTIDDKKTIERMKRMGVDGITSNYPDRI